MHLHELYFFFLCSKLNKFSTCLTLTELHTLNKIMKIMICCINWGFSTIS